MYGREPPGFLLRPMVDVNDGSKQSLLNGQYSEEKKRESRQVVVGG